MNASVHISYKRSKSHRAVFWEKHNIDDECKTKTIYNDTREDFETTLTSVESRYVEVSQTFLFNKGL